jgi:hypothetical protein
MEIKDDTFPAATFEGFCEANRLVLTVGERAGVVGRGRYFATCEGADVREQDGMLLAEFGDGSTREEAVMDYARRLKGKRIVVDAMLRSRRELQCPNEWVD